MNTRHLVGAIALAMAWSMVPASRAAAPAGDALPEIVLRGLSAFKVNGGRLAVENWTRGGPLEKTAGEADEIEAVEKLTGLYGRYQGHALVGRVVLSSESSLYYLEIQLEEGPIYVRMHVFSGRNGPRVVRLAIDAHPERVIPDYVLERQAR